MTTPTAAALAGRDVFERGLRLALATTIAVTFVVHAVGGPDWELLVSKHYWSRDFYYGGFAMQLATRPDGYRTIQVEGLANVTNLVALTDTARYNPRGPHYSGFPGTERLLVPFGVTAVVRMTGVDVLTAFWLVNVAAWLAAVAAAYRIATMFFSDRYSPLFMAIAVAAYPIFTLTFNGVKVAHLGTSYLLVGIYAYETMLRHRPGWLHPIGLGALMLVGMFASGGWAMLALYIGMRQAWITGYRRWVNLAVLLVAVGAARWIVAYMTAHYRLPSVEQYLGINYRDVLAETWQWMVVWIRGGDVTPLKFFNLPGPSVYDRFVPTITRAFFAGHLWIVVAAVAASWFVPVARMFAIIAAPMFVLGHSATALTGWAGWHYGYLSAPAATLLCFALSAGLGAVAAQRGPAGKIAAVIFLAGILVGFSDLKRHAGLFWGGDPHRYETRVIVHYEEHDREVVY